VSVLAGTVFADQYQVVASVGGGGMADVFAATRRSDGVRVALKVLRAESTVMADAPERLRREAIAAAKIRSEHVARVLDCVEDARHGIAIVFELLEGETLEARLRREQRMSFAQAHPIVEQILAGLGDAHAVPVVHRDLKPGNVFLQAAPDGGTVVKLLDFGISKMPADQGFDALTQKGQSLGTFAYMPPEQFESPSKVDATADLYACGAVIFRMLTGELPYVARGVGDLIVKKRSQEARKLNSALPRGEAAFAQPIEGYVAKLLSTSPSARFASAREALEAWQALASFTSAPKPDPPVPMSPPPPGKPSPGSPAATPKLGAVPPPLPRQAQPPAVPAPAAPGPPRPAGPPPIRRQPTLMGIGAPAYQAPGVAAPPPPPAELETVVAAPRAAGGLARLGGAGPSSEPTRAESPGAKPRPGFDSPQAGAPPPVPGATPAPPAARALGSPRTPSALRPPASPPGLGSPSAKAPPPPRRQEPEPSDEEDEDEAPTAFFVHSTTPRYDPNGPPPAEDEAPAPSPAAGSAPAFDQLADAEDSEEVPTAMMQSPAYMPRPAAPVPAAGRPASAAGFPPPVPGDARGLTPASPEAGTVPLFGAGPLSALGGQPALLAPAAPIAAQPPAGASPIASLVQDALAQHAQAGFGAQAPMAQPLFGAQPQVGAPFGAMPSQQLGAVSAQQLGAVAGQQYPTSEVTFVDPDRAPGWLKGLAFATMASAVAVLGVLGWMIHQRF
jgi:serine/threonine-protein kinase